MESPRGGCYRLEKAKPYLAVLFVQLIYAGMAVLSKAAISSGMNPFIFVAYRQAFSAILLVPFALLLERNMAAALSRNIVLKIFFMSLFGTTLFSNLYYYSLDYIPATFAAATANTIPAITVVMAVLFRMESLTITKSHGMAKVLGCVIGISGAMIYAFLRGPPLNIFHWSKTGHHKEILNSNMKNTSQWQWAKGSLLLFSSHIAWSSWMIMQGFVVKEYPAKMGLTTLQCLFSFLQSALFALAVERHGSSWKLGWNINLISVAYSAVIVGGVAFWLQLWTVEKKGPVFTAMFTPCALIITAIFSSIVWKEILHLGSVCGAILLVMGLYLVLWGKNREAEEAKAESKRKEAVQKSESREEAELMECASHR